jgi:hypothetical protein
VRIEAEVHRLKVDLDRLLSSLDESTPDHARLPDLERLLWQRLGSGESSLYWRRVGFRLGITAVFGAFLWGVLMGAHVTPPPQSGQLLVEPAEFLAPSADDLSP